MHSGLRLFLTGLEPRLLTRFDCRRYAREAYDLGVRYIGGCCGFEPYHIREIAEEVSFDKREGFHIRLPGVGSLEFRKLIKIN